MYYNNWNNLEATFVKLSEKSTILLWNLLMFGNNSLGDKTERFVAVTVKRSKKSFRY